MEAATETKEKKKPGRPPIFSKVITTIWKDDHGNRGAVNLAYVCCGLEYLQEMIGKDETTAIFQNKVNGNFRYQGALEQLGRNIISNLFTDEELNEMANLILQKIEAGEKSKDIEKGLRNIRKVFNARKDQKGGNHNATL